MAWDYNFHLWAKRPIGAVQTALTRYVNAITPRNRGRGRTFWFGFGGCLFWFIIGFFFLMAFLIGLTPAVAMLATIIALMALNGATLILEGLCVYPAVMSARAVREIRS